MLFPNMLISYLVGSVEKQPPSPEVCSNIYVKRFT